MLRRWLTLLCFVSWAAFPALIAQTGPLPAGFQAAPVYVPLFTPRGAPAGSYQTFVSARDLDAVLAALPGEASLATGDGHFRPRPAGPAEAFGQSGGYNRWKLALLYGGRRVRVARGPRIENGTVVEAWTLVSPYPDPELERLNPGTLLIVFRLPR